MKRTELEKENTPKRKQPRKSVSKSRVSFGSVSVHHCEKVETSPTPEATAVYPSLLLIATELPSPIRQGVSKELATPSPPQPKRAAAAHASV